MWASISTFFCNWRISALQYSVGFCQTSTEISHRFTYVPSHLNIPPTSLPIPATGIHMSPPSHLALHPTPLGCHRVPDLGSLHHTADFHWLANFTYGNVYVSIHVTLSFPPPPCPQVHFLCLHLHCCPAGSSVPSFWIPYVCVSMWYLSFSFWTISLIQYALGSSTSLELSQMHSFLWLSIISLCIGTTTSLSIHLWMDT